MSKQNENPSIAFFFWTNENFGGAERRYARLAMHLQSANLCNVTVFGKAGFFKSLNDIGVELSECEVVEYLPSKKNSKFSNAVMLLKSFGDVRAGNFAHVHLCVNPALVSFLYALFSLFLPRFSLSMNAGLFADNASYLAKTVFAPFSVAMSVAVDCLGPRYKKEFEQFIGPASRVKLHVAPCSFLESKQSCLAESRDIDICFAGRFVRGKGLEILEKALEGESGLAVHVCGHGPIQPRIQNAKTYHSNDVFGVLCRSRIFVSLQRKDNYPSQSLLEAMRAGCAIISTDVGDTRLLLNENNAVLIPPDPTELQATISSLLGDDARRKELGNAAKRTMQEEHTIERYSEYFLSKIVTH